ncbi:response regulator [Paenibacillus sp. LjRoot153]|uniref:response regulator n=1 Tax=Paenibacillus sp. LjRoot153 TaxID=3342270 RepID=UPI003ED1102E
MFKMLIVEDERWEREGLLDFLDWGGIGIEIVGTAVDGIDGLEKSLSLLPDIIVTDIQMPGMNGLQMAQKVREWLPDVRIIVLTGYDDFSYAREAIQFGADNYVLKPVEEEEMRKVMDKVVRDCELKRRKKQEEEALQQELLSRERVAAEKKISDLLKGRRRDATPSSLMDEHGLSIHGLAYSVMIVVTPSGDVESRIRQALNGLCVVVGCDEIDQASVVIVPIQAEHPFPAELAERLVQAAGELSCIGVGEAVPEIDQIHESYKQAVNTVRFGMFRDRRGFVTYTEVEQVKQDFSLHSHEFFKKWQELSRQLRIQVAANDAAKLDELLEELFHEISLHPGAGKDYIAAHLNILIGEISLMEENGTEGTFSGEMHLGQDLLMLNRLQDMQNYVRHFIIGLWARLDEKRNRKDDYIVNKVIRLIERSYGSSSFSLTMAASEVFLSPNHLSVILKKAIGKSLHEYLLEYRMKKAEELLRTTRNKVSWVAEQVGIPNTSYFGTLFKQAYGMTPGEYQEFMLRK